MATPSISLDRISVPLALMAGLVVGTWGFSRTIVTTTDLKMALEAERSAAVVLMGPMIDAKLARLDTAISALVTKVGELSEKAAALQASAH